MPSPWSARLSSPGHPNSNSNPNPNPNSNSNANSHGHGTSALSRGPARDAHFTSLPYEPPPTLHHERLARQASPRPKTSHGRTPSSTLPKFFGRKKSTNDFHDTDVPLDDNLVPVLDDTPKPDRTPSRVFSGKKTKQDDEGNKVSRRCMCCDNKVSVPKTLEKFRCMACVTINDLKPIGQQKDSSDKKLDDPADGSQPLRIVPLTLERTRAIIDRCLVAYLESRCRIPSGPLHSNGVSSASPRNVALPGPDLEREKIDHLPQPPPSHNAPQPARSDFVELHGPAPGALPRKPVPMPVPERPRRDPPPPPLGSAARTPTKSSARPQSSQKPPPSPRAAQDAEYQKRYERAKVIFRPLEEYILATFGEYECLNNAFNSTRPSQEQARAKSAGNLRAAADSAAEDLTESGFHGLSELDGKTLLLGELGENSTWWTGKLDRLRSDKGKRKKVGEGSNRAVSSRSPNIEWEQLGQWYESVHSAGKNWRSRISRVRSDGPTISATLEGRPNAEDIESDLEEARQHAIRALLKVSENILKRPTRPLKEPEEVRFLLIILANPSLYPAAKAESKSSALEVPTARRQPGPMLRSPSTKQPVPSPGRSADAKSRTSPQHTGILKRVFGLLANATDTCHRYLINWLARFEEDRFVGIVDLVASFVNHRLGRSSHSRHRSNGGLDDGGLIPDLSGSAMNTSAQLHSAMGLSGSMKKPGGDGDAETEWANDWQVKTAAKFMALLFTANNIWQGRIGSSSKQGRSEPFVMSANSPAAKARRSGQLVHTSSFYNTLLDYRDMITDFKTWETKRDKFAFCQYPLFLSMGTKIKILEYDARRQMESKAREAYFDQVIQQRAIDGHFHLRIRRECMVDDSLRQISEAVGSGQEELKKGLRVHFTGEEGVDAGGPRKEWFLMLVRDIFDPNHGMFVYDEESLACYFNPSSFETSDQFYLVGALLGLAIYNSTILDVALPPFAFRKLLAAAPSSISNTSNLSSITGTKGQMTHTVADLAEFRPSLAAGLQQLLDFEGDVEETYCWNFVVPVERYGTVVNVPLVSNGEGTPVTNSNRHEFVDAYIRYVLDTSVAKQFEPFKRGFFTVCAGNALSLFRAEEIELLVRGSDEPLDVDSLKAVAVYENWRSAVPPHAVVANPGETVPVVGWFWEIFAEASPEKQRQLLTFITGTDRIPAVGATSLILRIVAGRDGWSGGGTDEKLRFPVARTCFNMLVLWRYDGREQLAQKLWMAVAESEGFGLK